MPLLQSCCLRPGHPKTLLPGGDTSTGGPGRPAETCCCYSPKSPKSESAPQPEGPNLTRVDYGSAMRGEDGHLGVKLAAATLPRVPAPQGWHGRRGAEGDGREKLGRQLCSCLCSHSAKFLTTPEWELNLVKKTMTEVHSSRLLGQCSAMK